MEKLSSLPRVGTKAQNISRPRINSAQPKIAAKPPGAATARTAPPVYRPVPPTLSAQPKRLAKPPEAYRPSATAQAKVATAPPVYRPAAPALSAQPKGLAKPPAVYRPSAMAQAKMPTTAPPVYRPPILAPSRSVQPKAGNISSSGEAEQRRKVLTPGSPRFWVRPAGIQRSSAVQRAQALEDVPVENAMDKATKDAKAFGENHKDGKDVTAEECVAEAFRITSAARQQMEGKGIDWRPFPSKVPYQKLALAQTQAVLAAENKQAAMATLYGELIANQVINEGNNRFTYVLLVILSTMFNTPLPSQEKMANRDKSVGFKAPKIRDQFLDMY